MKNVISKSPAKEKTLTVEANAILSNIGDVLSDFGQYNSTPLQRRIEMTVTNGVNYTPWKPRSKEGNQEDYFRFREECEIFRRYDTESKKMFVLLAEDLARTKEAIQSKLQLYQRLTGLSTASLLISQECEKIQNIP